MPDFKNLLIRLLDSEFARRIKALESPPTALMSGLTVSVPILNNTVIAPYTTNVWHRDTTVDPTLGTITVLVEGIYIAYIEMSGDAAGPNTTNIFEARINGVPQLALESIQKQTDEGVQITITAPVRLFVGDVVDVFLTGDSDITLHNMIFSIEYSSNLEGVIQDVP